MTISEAYISFLTKVNQNYKSNNITASKDRFIRLYNEEQVRYIELILERKNDDEIRQINKFLTSKVLNTSTIQDTKFTFSLPDNFLDFSSAFSKVSTTNCKDIRVSLFEIKDFNTEQVLLDNNNKPSLSYREAPCYIGNESINIFTEGFNVDSVTLSYYRYPNNVDIEGYIHIGSNIASSNVDPEGDNAFINKVISGCAESFFRNYGDTTQVQINKDRIINNN